MRIINSLDILIGPLKKRIALFLSYLSKRLIGKHTLGILVKGNDSLFLVDPQDMGVGRVLRNSGSYGQNELKIINRLISKNSNIIFIGTHIGALAIPTAKKVKEAIFIEANPNTYSLLNKNISLNNLKNVISHNIAAGEKNKTIKFLISKVNSGGSKREPIFKKKFYYFDNPQIASVPMRVLDELVTGKADFFDLIYMDIEGSEYFALKGMNKILQKTKSIVVEFIPHHIKNVSCVSVEEFLLQFLENFNFCYVPSLNKYLKKSEFLSNFEKMYRKNICDDGVIFSKEQIIFH